MVVKKYKLPKRYAASGKEIPKNKRVNNSGLIEVKKDKHVPTITKNNKVHNGNCKPVEINKDKPKTKTKVKTIRTTRLSRKNKNATSTNKTGPKVLHKPLRKKITGRTKSNMTEYNYRASYAEDVLLFTFELSKSESEKLCAKRLLEVKNGLENSCLGDILDKVVDLKAEIHHKLVGQKEKLIQNSTKLTPDSLNREWRIEWTVLDKLVSDVKLRWANNSVSETKHDIKHIDEVFKKMYKRIDDKLFMKMIDLTLEKSKRKPDVPTGIWKHGKVRTANMKYEKVPPKIEKKTRRHIKPRIISEDDESQYRKKFETYGQVYDPYDPNLFF